IPLCSICFTNYAESVNLFYIEVLLFINLPFRNSLYMYYTGSSLVLNNTSVVTFLSGNKDRYVVTRYYYDIEKGNPNATIMMIDNQKKEFKDTSVTEEVEDGKWISHNSGIFLTRKRVYFVNDKRVKEINLNGLKTNVSLIADNKLYLYTISKRHTISLYQIRGTL
ncbi:MAG: hypothetical protein DUD27_09670, partial [Lachnospiraceae bacterium]